MAAPNSTAPSTSNSPADPQGILLDAGTNEVEILLFRVGEQHCGVNVAKVREVRTMALASPSIFGRIRSSRICR